MRGERGEEIKHLVAMIAKPYIEETWKQRDRKEKAWVNFLILKSLNVHLVLYSSLLFSKSVVSSQSKSSIWGPLWASIWINYISLSDFWATAFRKFVEKSLNWKSSLGTFLGAHISQSVWNLLWIRPWYLLSNYHPMLKHFGFILSYHLTK